MNHVRRWLLLASIVGFTASLLVQALAIFDVTIPYRRILAGLWTGAIATWMAALFSAGLSMGSYKPSEFWKAALRGCPGWMIRVVMVLLGYLVIGTAGSAIYHVFAGRAEVGAYESARFSSSGVMAVYFLSTAMFYSAVNPPSKAEG